MFLRYGFFFVYLCLVGCVTQKAPPPSDLADQKRRSFGSLLDEGWLNFGGNKKAGSTDSTPLANPYLWRAGLEQLQFMPLASADVKAGVVLSDWYTSADNPHSKVKISMYVCSNEFRPDALKIIVHRQNNKSGSLVVQDTEKAKEIENIIWKKAQILYIENKKN